MARKVDPALTRQAINWLKRARARAEGSDEGVTAWEDDFLTSVEERLERYGSAFADPDKGQLSAPLSLRQGLKVRQIGKRGAKRRGKAAGGSGAEDARAEDGEAGDVSAPPPRPGAGKAGLGRTGGSGSGFGRGKNGGLARKSGLTRKSPLRARRPDPERE